MIIFSNFQTFIKQNCVFFDLCNIYCEKPRPLFPVCFLLTAVSVIRTGAVKTDMVCVTTQRVRGAGSGDPSLRTPGGVGQRTRWPQQGPGQLQSGAPLESLQLLTEVLSGGAEPGRPPPQRANDNSTTALQPLYNRSHRWRLAVELNDNFYTNIMFSFIKKGWTK